MHYAKSLKERDGRAQWKLRFPEGRKTGRISRQERGGLFETGARIGVASNPLIKAPRKKKLESRHLAPKGYRRVLCRKIGVISSGSR